MNKYPEQKILKGRQNKKGRWIVIVQNFWEYENEKRYSPELDHALPQATFNTEEVK